MRCRNKPPRLSRGQVLARDFFASLLRLSLAVRPAVEKLAVRNYLAAMFSNEGCLTLRSSIADDPDRIKRAPSPAVVHFPSAITSASHQQPTFFRWAEMVLCCPIKIRPEQDRRPSFFGWATNADLMVSLAVEISYHGLRGTLVAPTSFHIGSTISAWWFVGS